MYVTNIAETPEQKPHTTDLTRKNVNQANYMSRKKTGVPQTKDDVNAKAALS